MAAWDRQAGETSKAYHYFVQYRDYGPERSLLKVSRNCTVTESRLKQLSDEWNWPERADQWDAYVQQIADRALLTEAAKRGRKRVAAFEKLLSTAEEALGVIDLEKANLGQAAAAMKAASDGLRTEDNLATQIVTMELQDVRAVLSRLPPEIRSTLLRALGEYAHANGRSELVGGVPGRSPYEE